jgi:CMP-N-acetylneuraminic acid synthetase
VPGDEETPQPIATYHYIKRPNRQDRKDWFLENGAVYFVREYILKHFKVRLHGSIGLYVMPKERSVEVDDEYDWKVAEFLMGGA